MYLRLAPKPIGIDRGYLIFFGVRSIFISPNEDQKPRVKIPLLVFMSEIKIALTPEKNKFSVSFMLDYGNN